MSQVEDSQHSIKVREEDNLTLTPTPTPYSSSNQADIPLEQVDAQINENVVEVDISESFEEKSQQSDIGPIGRQKSKVWSHFKQITVNGNPKAECIYCKTILVSGAKNGTRHLHDHVKSCTKKKNQDIRQCLLAGKQSSLSSTVTTMTAYHFNQEVSRKDLAEMVILHEYPLSMVDHYGFKKFCTSLQPLFKVISRNTLKKDILKIYDLEKAKMLALLNKNRGRIAITCDMWTANHQNKSYMAITAHFVDNSWVLQHRILRFVYVPVPHTSELLSKVLEESFFDWNVDRKLSTITVDNCSTNDAIIEDLTGKLQRSSLILRGSLFHMRCSAHILNLIVQDGLSVIHGEIEKVRESVRFWTASSKREQRFEEAARQIGTPHTKKLVLDCKTRWNSTFLMLSTALLYKDVFYRLKHRERLYNCLPTEDEWFLAQEICDHLHIFYNATEIFSKTNSPTVNVFFPIVCNIRIELDKWLVGGNELVRIMAEKMITKFDKYWSDVHGVMSVAIMLDPRYKMSLVNYVFPKIFGGDANKKIEEVKKFCVDLYNEYKLRNEKQSTKAIGSSSSDCCIELGKRSRAAMEDNLAGFDDFIACQESNLQEKSELDRYLEEGHLPRNLDLEILTWWKTNGSKYPILQMIARDILSIPVSTVASESAFSTGGRIVDPHRSRLHSNTLEALMCAQNWLSANIKGSSTSDGDFLSILEDVDDEGVSEIATIDVD